MTHNSSDWVSQETTRHQDHVIAHVVGATVLGWFVAGEAAHLLLDIGFLWTIYLDGEMNLLPQGVAISELDADELTSADKAELAFDAYLLLSEGREASGLNVSEARLSNAWSRALKYLRQMQNATSLSTAKQTRFRSPHHWRAPSYRFARSVPAAKIDAS